MEATMEQCSSDFDAPGADKMDEEELQPFESVTLPPIKVEQEEAEEGDAATEEEVEEEEDFESSGNFLPTSMSPVKDESEVPVESEEEEEIEPSSFLSVSMTTVKDEPEEQQEEDDEELEPLASVIVSSPMDEVLSKGVSRNVWGEQLQQQPMSGRRVVSSSGVWVPGVEDPLPSDASAKPQPLQQPSSTPAAATSNTRKPFSCDVCAKSFTQKYTLKMHRRVHSEKMPFRCRACPESFESPSALSLHVAAHKAQRRYPCDVCGASFIQKGELNIHLRSHSEARPHECTMCDKAYKQKPNKESGDVPVTMHETSNVANLMESSGINYTSQNKDIVVNKGGPPKGHKRKAEKSRVVVQPMDENSFSLKETIAEPKEAKDESQLFCELLRLKLRTLNDDACEIAMHEINNLMYHLKNSRMLQSNELPFHHYCQQSGYIQSDVKQFQTIKQQPVSVCKSQVSSVSPSLLRGLLQVNKKMV